jgi:hypothetical protein
MTLATKNGAIIVKDGKLAENCGCCGGWYCCQTTLCPASSISSVQVSITAQDWYQRSIATVDNTLVNYESSGSPIGVLNGTHSLTLSGSQWAKQFSSSSTNCSNKLAITLAPIARPGNIAGDLWKLTITTFSSSYQSRTVERWKSVSELPCLSGMTGDAAASTNMQEWLSWKPIVFEATSPPCNAIDIVFTGFPTTAPISRSDFSYDARSGVTRSIVEESGVESFVVNSVTVSY